MSLITSIFGDPSRRATAALMPIVKQINAHEATMQPLDDEGLRAKTTEFRERLQNGEALEHLLPEAFAAAREAARRTLGQRHFDVQLIGGMVLHQGKIAEMRTGEGKTLTATLPVYLNALTGRGVHVVTVNDYLSARDTAWMGQVYYALGMSIGCIQHESAFVYDPEFRPAPQEEAKTASFKVAHDFLRPVPRREAYHADITYGTNNEFGFDYLRDHMAYREMDLVQRELHYAIVDEVDSILIDEARTPLIISAPAEESTDQYYRFAEMVRLMQEGVDFNVDLKMRAATFTEVGQDRVRAAIGFDAWEQSDFRTVHHLEQALRAHALFKLDKDYVVREGEVVIVDEFTGRLMFGRRYSEGLHQAIEAKEGVQIQRESQTLATITFQNYFRMFAKLAGMTGTAATEAEEFSKIYKLDVVQVPTHRPMVRTDLGDRVYKNENGKLKAVVAEIKERSERGQPVLVGTVSIAKNERLGEMLTREGVPHTVLNAKNHEREGEIIAQAGRRGGVTIATNMAGRGVDIILGGNPPDQEIAEEVKSLGGLHVIGTERHESRRIDNQLRGRAGRQGDLGSSQFYISLEDDLMKIFAPERVKYIMEKLGLPDEVPIENKMVSRSIESAQKKVEGHNFDIRKHLLEYDDVLNKHREVIYKKRREILLADEEAGTIESLQRITRMRILEMVKSEIEQVVSFHTAAEHQSDWNVEEVLEVMHTIYPVGEELRVRFRGVTAPGAGRLEAASVRTEIIQILEEQAAHYYVELEKRIGDSKMVHEIERAVLLRAIDTLWVEHLDAMEHLRTGIGLQGYGQRDPLVEYKRQSYQMFQELLNAIQRQVVYAIFKVGTAAVAQLNSQRRGMQFTAPAKEGDAGKLAVGSNQLVVSKVGRNDPCPCGSGKKFKRCHGV